MWKFLLKWLIAPAAVGAATVAAAIFGGGLAVTGVAYALVLGTLGFCLFYVMPRSAIAGIAGIALAAVLTVAYEYQRPGYVESTRINDAINVIDASTKGDDFKVLASSGEYTNNDSWAWWKFDSTTVHSEATAARNDGTEVSLIYTGIRIKLPFDMAFFPNVITLNPGIFTWFIFAVHYTVWSVLFGLIGLAGFKIASRSKKATV